MRLGDNIEHCDEGLPDHQYLRQLIGQEVIRLILQELDKLSCFEGGMVINSNSELKFLTAVHHDGYE